MKRFVREFLDFNNWKKNPTSIFFHAGPLFVLAMCFMTTQAILEARINHDFTYLWIEAGGIALLLFGLSPIALFEYDRRKLQRKYDREQEISTK